MVLSIRPAKGKADALRAGFHPGIRVLCHRQSSQETWSRGRDTQGCGLVGEVPPGSDGRETVAQARLKISQARQPVRGRMPDGPLRLTEARLHLERELREHQAKLDRSRAGLPSDR